MVWTKLFIYNIIIWLITSSKLLIRAEEKLNSTRMDFNETQTLKILPGIKFSLTNDKIIFHVKIQDLLQETEVQSRKKQENPWKRIGSMMMMAPFLIQMFSFPGAVASIKMSLLRSIMVAQLAIAIMIYNLIKSKITQNSEVVVIHHQKHHQGHYSHGSNYPKDDEDEWFGK
ncbi:hypothetical protein ACFW04_001674 [Cataglyphis niger]